MIQARDYLNRAGKPNFWMKFAFNILLPNPLFLYWILKISFIGKSLGFSWLLRKTGILKRFFPGIEAADILVNKVSIRFLQDRPEAQRFLERSFRKEETEYFEAQHRFSQMTKQAKRIPDKLKEKIAVRPSRPRVAVLPVCGSQYLRPSIGLSTIKILEKLRIEFIIPETTCCGLPAASYGALDAVRKIASANIERMERGRFETILTDDSSCTAHFKDYHKFFQDDPIMYEKAYTISQKVREMSSFFIQFGILDLLKKTKWTGGSVAYHDPCKAQYGQKITQPPRQILAGVPGLQLVPIADSDQCCGGGGTYCLVHPSMSQGVLDAKIKNIAKTKCQTVVTSSASCLTQIEFGLREKYPNIKIFHLSEFIANLL